MRTLIVKQEISISLIEAWNFFSSPSNLKVITPEYMGFDIISKNKLERMYPGMIIAYRIKPFLSIPLTWVTEITHVREPYYFIDNQKAGPYKFWHHQHIFRETEKGTEITDIVNYATPGGLIGRMAEKLYINAQVNNIFKYRKHKISELF